MRQHFGATVIVSQCFKGNKKINNSKPRRRRHHTSNNRQPDIEGMQSYITITKNMDIAVSEVFCPHFECSHAGRSESELTQPLTGLCEACCSIFPLKHYSICCI